MKNLLILMAFLGLTLSAQAQVAVVVNKNVAESSLTKETVKKIFELNQLRWGKDKAAFARPEYARWFDLWEEEGALSLGRVRNYDWMHVQFARL